MLSCSVYKSTFVVVLYVVLASFACGIVASGYDPCDLSDPIQPTQQDNMFLIHLIHLDTPGPN